MVAAAQRTPAPPPAEPNAPPPPRILGAVGPWVQQGAATVAKGAADAARDTAATVGRLPAAGFVGGRERCVLAPNGAPDCRAAAEAMCRASGGGSSIDFETAEQCPPRYRVLSRDTRDSVCTLEHFVTRALCQ